MEWIFYYLAIHPDIQDRICQEIELAFGPGKPTLENKKSTPYLEAFIEEVMRFCPLTFFAPPHAATDDTTVNGYLFPKGTMV